MSKATEIIIEIDDKDIQRPGENSFVNRYSISEKSYQTILVQSVYVLIIIILIDYIIFIKLFG